MKDFELLEIILDSRKTHGLAHQDYSRYSRYSTRKISSSKDNPLILLLFKSERDWAHAQYFKQSQDPRKKHHAIRKLKRASQYSSKLLHSSAALPAPQLLQVKAYSAWMHGLLKFEQQAWQDAMNSFASARSIYASLAISGTPSHETQCHIAMDEIDPNIRYCAYNLRIYSSQTMDVSDLIRSSTKNLDEHSKIIHAKNTPHPPLTWRSHSIILKKDWVVSLESLKQFQHELNSFSVDLSDSKSVETKLSLYDRVLGQYWEATAEAERDLKAHMSHIEKLKSSKTDEKTENLNIYFGYITYHRLETTIKRDHFLIELSKYKLENNVGGSKIQEIVLLSDAILKLVAEMQALSLLEKDPALSCIEAYVLLQKALEYIQELKSTPLSKDDNEWQTLLENALKRQLEINGQMAKITAQMYQRGMLSVEKVSNGLLNLKFSKNKKMPLASRLDEFSLISNRTVLVEFPPKLIPIPFKPLLLDIAYDYIAESPDNDDQNTENMDVEQTKPASSGILGVFSGIWS